jgi:hypothetical protein
MSFNEFAIHRPSSKVYCGRKLNPQLSMASVSDVLPASVSFHRWALGFRQFRFSHIAQALQGRTIHVFRILPALQTCSCPLALSGSG